MKTQSVTEYYENVSGGKMSITGSVVGPYTMPHPESYYAHSGHGMKGPALTEPNRRTLGADAVTAVENAGIELNSYDNKGRADGYVDAFIVVHAGRGGEETLNVDDLWSCKWFIAGNGPREVGASKTRVFPFLTIPEDAKLGVCAHELGHLIFGWPDLYDVSDTSRGIGEGCLISGGSWGCVDGGTQGTTPCHPSAWCKLDQEWVDLVSDSTDGDISLNDVKATATDNLGVGNVHKLWSDGLASTEYFLVENRMKSGFDRSLPSEGLLIWHVDESVENNNDSLPYYKIALMSADGAAKLTRGGSAGCPYPGIARIREFANQTLPNSRDYNGRDTYVAVRQISDAGPSMRMSVAVKSHA